MKPLEKNHPRITEMPTSPLAQRGLELEWSRQTPGCRFRCNRSGGGAELPRGAGAAGSRPHPEEPGPRSCVSLTARPSLSWAPLHLLTEASRWEPSRACPGEPPIKHRSHKCYVIIRTVASHTRVPAPRCCLRPCQVAPLGETSLNSKSIPFEKWM